MRSMDGPDRESDSRARPPAELFDNLRLRLSQLAENHPSAPQRGEETGRGPGESPRRPDGLGPRRDEFAGRDAAADDGEFAGPAAAGRGPGGDGERGPVTAPADGGGALRDPDRGGPDLGDVDLGGLELGDVELGDLDLPGLRGASEAYRPWFMSGEPGAPWWAAGEDI